MIIRKYLILPQRSRPSLNQSTGFIRTFTYLFRWKQGVQKKVSLINRSISFLTVQKRSILFGQRWRCYVQFVEDIWQYRWWLVVISAGRKILFSMLALLVLATLNWKCSLVDRDGLGLGKDRSFSPSVYVTVASLSCDSTVKSCGSMVLVEDNFVISIPIAPVISG